MKKLSKQNIILCILIVFIVITPLFLHKDSDFEGADGEAENLIQEIKPEYEPWFEPFWEPPSGEIESLLFSLQVAIGAGLMGYVLGTFKERKKNAPNR